MGKRLVNGVGIGKISVNGKICKANTESDFNEKLQKGDILVVDVLNDEFVQTASQKAAAIIAEEGGLTSSTAIVGLTFGIPVIVGVQNAVSTLEDGQFVTVDTVAGIVYEGNVNLK